MSGDLLGDVESFVLRHIHSTEQLEILLLLSSQLERDWTVAEVYRELKTNPNSIGQRLEELARSGFLAATATNPPGYRFVPSALVDSRCLQQLGMLYRDRKHRIIELIYRKPSSAILSFAEAFRWRKD
jgi:hypothetical protein